ncbi:MAG: DUF2127 domain-containing protein [Solirubrobacterales bacterium]
MKKNILHESFEIGILFKAIDGVLEIIGGFLLLFLDPLKINKIITMLTWHELSEDPRDLIANYIIKFSSSFSVDAQHFGVIYLFSHGIVKIILVYLLWKGKLWSYPLAVVFLVLFIVYQMYRYTFTYSIGLVLLSIFDAVMIALTLMEYKRIKFKF